MTAIPPPPPDLGRRAAWLARAIRASPHNLVSPRAKAELETRHIPECLALAEFLPPGPASLVDIGSGAGLPGVLVALRRPDLTVTLIEATSKKARFLQRAGLALQLPGVEVLHARAEELHRGPLAGRFDLATARAVAPLDRLLLWTMPLLRPGGRLYAVKGSGWREELQVARTTAARDWEVVALPSGIEASAGAAPGVVIIERAAR